MLKLIRFFPVIVLLLALYGCGSKISQDNFSKIQTDMPMAEVVKILGEPSTSQSSDVMGFSIATATWEDKSNRIVISFYNDKVKTKNFSPRQAVSQPAE